MRADKRLAASGEMDRVRGAANIARDERALGGTGPDIKLELSVSLQSITLCNGHSVRDLLPRLFHQARPASLTIPH